MFLYSTLALLSIGPRSIARDDRETRRCCRKLPSTDRRHLVPLIAGEEVELRAVVVAVLRLELDRPPRRVGW